MSNIPKHSHKNCISKALEDAAQVCFDRGVKLTPIRQRVLEIIWKNHEAAKAYDILQQLDIKDGSLTPPTVYRAIDFLVAQGLVHKIESMNGYVGCSHPLNNHGCQFLICNECGNVKEFCDDKLIQAIEKNTAQEGFIFKHHILEVYGICASCQ